nr:hypothetical protein [uncultured Rhodopila sp.]
MAVVTPGRPNFGRPEALQWQPALAPDERTAMPIDTHVERSDRDQDETLKDTFPASDPPANSGVTGAEPPNTPPHERTIEESPTGLPTSDRHGAETAHQWEHEEKPSGE